MNSTDGITITGFEELKAKIIELSKDKDKRSEMLILLRQIASPTLLAAKTIAPFARKSHVARGKRIQPGNLKSSLGYITGKSSNPTIYVGPRVKGSQQGWYGAMVESGHAIYRNSQAGKKLKNGQNKSVLSRITKKRVGNVVGNVPGQFYMKRAYETTGGLVTADAEKKFAAFIQRRINKLSK